MRQTVSEAGADDEPEPDPEPVEPLLDELLELQPPATSTAASAAAVPSASLAGVFLSPTAGHSLPGW